VGVLDGDDDSYGVMTIIITITIMMMIMIMVIIIIIIMMMMLILGDEKTLSDKAEAAKGNC
jgi:uncharacterized membrane protein